VEGPKGKPACRRAKSRVAVISASKNAWVIFPMSNCRMLKLWTLNNRMSDRLAHPLPWPILTHVPPNPRGLLGCGFCLCASKLEAPATQSL